MHLLKSVLTACIVMSSLLILAQPGQQQDTVKINSKEFTMVEIEAEYPGGSAAWKKFLEKNLNSGIPAQNNAPVGKYPAAVMFIVDKDGTVSNVTSLTKFGYGMEEELKRVIENSGKWTPASQNGKPVRAYRKQPVTFLLDSDDFKITTDEPYTLFANTDNKVTITARKVKPADIAISVSGGGKSIPLEDGKFIIQLSKPGRVTIEIVNSKKDDKQIGTASFEVKIK